MSFYSNISTTAKNLIVKFGKNITISREISGTFNPVTGITTGASTQSEIVKAVVLPASGGKIQALDLRFKLGSMEYERLNYFQISGEDLTFAPTPGDTVTIATEEWTVLGVTPLNPNDGTPMLYEVAIRI